MHNVCINGFYIDKHEVTNSKYKACVDAGTCTAPSSTASNERATYYGDQTYDDFPVIYVNWNQATAYCTWAGKRLPTEAEWEYAARGGLSGKRYPWGDTISGADANYWNSGDAWDEDTSPVGNYAANGYGIYDMGGNVWEWVSDWYDSGYYSVSPANDPQGPASGSSRVLRSGGWNSSTASLRVTYRYADPPTFGGNGSGFRCARNSGFKLPDTGQMTSYTATFGEDSDYTINPMAFTNTGSGTVVDNNTSLMWQQQDDDVTRTWADAGTYCDGLSFAGHSDWRLPSNMELLLRQSNIAIKRHRRCLDV